jgi:MFS family permease
MNPNQETPIGWLRPTRTSLKFLPYENVRKILIFPFFRLTQSAVVLITGRLGAIYGHTRLLLLGGIIIVIFSICNAFCNTYTSFIAIRALTGVGGGVVMPNAVATLTIMVPPGRARNVTLATFAATPPLGALVGALLAGIFLQYAEWKWLFITV